MRIDRNTFKTIVRCFNVLPGKYARRSDKPAGKKEVGEPGVKTENALNANFLTRAIGSTHGKWSLALVKHPELKTLKRKDVVNSATTLKGLNYTVDDILSKPMALYYNSLTIDNRFKVLRECCFEPVPISILVKFVVTMNKTVCLLKSHGYIPASKNLLEELKSCFSDASLDKLDTESCTDNLMLKELRERVLNAYFRERLGCSDADIEKLWKCYARVRHRSFGSVKNMTNVLLDDLHFTKDRIIKNGYLLYGEPDNVRRILKEIQSIDGHDIREIAFRRPKILMSNCDALVKNLQHIKSFGIGEDAVLRCLEVLTLGPDTIFGRLQDLQQIEEFQVLGTNPRVLRLVHYQNKARLRLAYLNQLKVRCASLHILSCGSDAFAKFARDGSDRTKGRDIIVYLSKVLGEEEITIRNQMSRHPNWCHIPALHVKNCYDFLRSKNFDSNSIYRNMHLLLYPINRIEEKLLLLRKPKFLQGMNVNVGCEQLSSSDILTMILYLIEYEFHFTGDGIWTEQHTQHVENFNNLLPDFPEGEKEYRFGVKPAKQNTDNKMRLQN